MPHKPKDKNDQSKNRTKQSKANKYAVDPEEDLKTEKKRKGDSGPLRYFMSCVSCAGANTDTVQTLKGSNRPTERPLEGEYNIRGHELEEKVQSNRDNEDTVIAKTSDGVAECSRETTTSEDHKLTPTDLPDKEEKTKASLNETKAIENEISDKTIKCCVLVDPGVRFDDLPESFMSLVETEAKGQTMDGVKLRVTRTDTPDHIQADSGILILPCIKSSRLESDIRAVLNTFTIKDEKTSEENTKGKQGVNDKEKTKKKNKKKQNEDKKETEADHGRNKMVLLIFHLLATATTHVTASHKLLDNNISDSFCIILDIFCKPNKQIYEECPHNRKAVEELLNYLMATEGFESSIL